MKKPRSPDSRADTFGEARLTVLGGRDILFVMAADAEYGPHLKERFEPFMTGVGPIEAAVELTAALAAVDRLSEALAEGLLKR